MDADQEWLDELHQQAEKRYREALAAMDYRTFLRSGFWLEMKRRVRQRADGLCEAKCGERGWQVHHKVYRGNGLEQLDDLELLCDECHLRSTSLRRGVMVKLARLATAKGVSFPWPDNMLEARQTEEWLRSLPPKGYAQDTPWHRRFYKIVKAHHMPLV